MSDENETEASNSLILKMPLMKPKKTGGHSYVIHKKEADKVMQNLNTYNAFDDTKPKDENEELRRVVLKLRKGDEKMTKWMHSFHKALAGLVASLLFLVPFFHKFSDHPAWCAITALSVLNPTLGSSVKQGYFIFILFF